MHVDPSIWYEATTLSERLAARRAAQGAASALSVSLPEDPWLALRALEEEVSEQTVAEVLAEPSRWWRSGDAARPSWLLALERVGLDPGKRDVLPPLSLLNPTFGRLLEGLAPLLDPARRRVLDAAEQAAREPGSPIDPPALESALAEPMASRLLWQAERTLVLELHIARLRGELRGDTPQARFEDFVERLRRPEVVAGLLGEYPALARQIATTLESWADASVEFIARLGEDWPALRERLGAPPRPIRAVEPASDLHQGGRSVLIVTFDGGFRLVYKPKPLAADAHFQALLSWLNLRVGEPLFRPIAILDRGSYGWAEFVEHTGCDSPEAVTRFYERQGAYLALLHALEGTDFHAGNVIASGEHPVIADLEGLFHPRLAVTDPRLPPDPAASALGRSVLRVGLLPLRCWVNGTSEGVELSGLGMEAGQLSPYGVPHWEEAKTDTMHAVRKPVRLEGERNRPTLGGIEQRADRHADALVAGFSRMYRLLVEHREALLAKDGPLMGFASAPVRVILRPTQTYARLLEESFHPDLLRSGIERDKLFDLLSSGETGLFDASRALRAERQDLHRGDIPLFRTLPSSRDLWTSTGERIEAGLPEAGLDVVRRRLQAASEEDLSRQLWIVRASLTLLSKGVAHAGEEGEPTGDAPFERGEAEAAARAVGDRLLAVAVQGEGGVSWVGLALQDERLWSLEPAGPSLYDGLPGIALFLAYLGALTGDARYEQLAREAHQTHQRKLAALGPTGAMGAFTGIAGDLYTALHLGALWGDAALLALAEQKVSELARQIDADEDLDVLGGSAGCIRVLLALREVTGSQAALEAAIRCGDRLAATAQAAGSGVAWQGRFPSVAPLTGFAHGASGMAWALAELFATTGEERYRTLAHRAMAYERDLFRPDERNWPDLRILPGEPAQDPPCRVSWCHGAPGIALARSRWLALGEDAALRAELEAAIDTTLRSGLGGNHSLCHGALGNLEILMRVCAQAGHRLPEVRRAAGGVLRAGVASGWHCGNPMWTESPGLMMGLAGIGLALLGLAHPGRVPSVLLLDPPPAGAR